ncbi:hypothetical protein [Natronobeatus ordinarius]|uniref:hypothetical protein n=1 Tax=Natronobeatus ordinarius TaxID=2963433 RepID=UPI0020CC3EC4|nr:hypothetical protein [Natronobeatus ordinarius]
MPASQTVTLIDGVDATVRAAEEDEHESKSMLEIVMLSMRPGYTDGGDRTIYFTDEKPNFRVEVTNETEYNFVEGSKISWCIAIGEGMPKPVHRGTIDINIPSGETREYEFGGDLLAFEGHGVVGLTSGGHSGGSKSLDRTLSSGSLNTYSPALSFSVWDREHYKVIHEGPKKMQETAVFITIVVAMVGLAQLLITFHQIIFAG